MDQWRQLATFNCFFSTGPHGHKHQWYSLACVFLMWPWAQSYTSLPMEQLFPAPGFGTACLCAEHSCPGTGQVKLPYHPISFCFASYKSYRRWDRKGSNGDKASSLGLSKQAMFPPWNQWPCLFLHGTGKQMGVTYKSRESEWISGTGGSRQLGFIGTWPCCSSVSKQRQSLFY